MGVLSTVGMFSTMGDIMSTVGDILSTMEGFQYRGDIMIHVGNIMSTVGCSVPWGTQITKDSPMVLMISANGTEHPTVLKISPTFIMISPMVLNIPTVLKISPHGTHDIPHGTEHPMVLSTPHGTAQTLYRVKTANDLNAPYMKELFIPRNSTYALRGSHNLSVPMVNQIT